MTRKLGPIPITGEMLNVRRREAPLMKGYVILEKDVTVLAYLQRTIPQVRPGWVLIMHPDQAFEIMDSEGFARTYEIVEMNQNDNGAPPMDDEAGS